MGLLERREVSAAELHAAYLDAIAERDGELHCYLRTCDEPNGDGHPDRAQGRHLDEGDRDDGRLEDPQRVHAGLRLDRRRAREEARASPSSARRTPTSSRWARRPRTRPGGRRATRGIRRAFPVDRAAAPPLPCRPGSRPGGSAPTPAARSSSRRHCAGTSACGRRTGPSRATGSSRSRRASTRSGQSRRPCATSRSSTRSSPGRDPLDSTTAELPEAVQLPEGDSLAGVRLARAEAGRRLSTRSSRVCARRSRARSSTRASSAPRWGSATCRSRIATECRATTSSRRRRRRRTSRATTASATGRASRARRTARWSIARATRVRRRAEAPHHARHVRALGRVLRRVLRPGAEGANAPHPGAPRGARGLRRHRDADVADGRIPDRRQGCRPARDVRLRPPHDPVVPRRAAGPLDPVRAVGGAPGRAAAHRARSSPRTGSSASATPSSRRSDSTPFRSGCDDLGTGDRARDPRAAEDADEDVLPLRRRFRRGGEHADLPGVPRIPGRAAGDEPPRDRVDDQARARARLRDRRAGGLRAQELLLPGPSEGLSDLPVRSTILH